MKRRLAQDVPALRRDAVDVTTLAVVRGIVEEVRAEGLTALARHAARLGDGPVEILDRRALAAVLDTTPPDVRALLERTADRIRTFALAQRQGMADVAIAVPGGAAGSRWAPVDRAGCYAPGGRFPLPSSVLMTAVTARAAGVPEVWAVSPRPAPITLAAAAVAGVDAFVTVGGAQAIAALAFGAGPILACDAIVGPGNRWVTAAKSLVAGHVAIEGLAGPSELVVIADGGADPALVAADLIAQAEHDPDALPVLLTDDDAFADAVDAALAAQLVDLPTAAIAREALENGFTVVAPLDTLAALSDRLAPEHLALQGAGAEALAGQLRHYGALFIGAGAAEVLGDYGAGPNHVLPTGGTARSVGALSVATFLRVQTWLRTEAPAELARDAAALGRLEGLEGHARAADRRR